MRLIMYQVRICGMTDTANPRRPKAIGITFDVVCSLADLNQVGPISLLFSEVLQRLGTAPPLGAQEPFDQLLVRDVRRSVGLRVRHGCWLLCCSLWQMVAYHEQLTDRLGKWVGFGGSASVGERGLGLVGQTNGGAPHANRRGRGSQRGASRNCKLRLRMTAQ